MRLQLPDLAALSCLGDLLVWMGRQSWTTVKGQEILSSEESYLASLLSDQAVKCQAKRSIYSP